MNHTHSLAVSELGAELHSKLSPWFAYDHLAVFLVGGQAIEHPKQNTPTLREGLRTKLEVAVYGKWIDVYYPEEIFTELLYRSRYRDLLQLEHLLAGWVHAIVVVAESPGALSELGAFASND